jgi:hypothetical protein
MSHLVILDRTGRSPEGPGGIFLRPSATDGSKRKVSTMPFLPLRAYWMLIRFNFYLLRGDFSALHQKVRNYPVYKATPTPDAIERICLAIEVACIWYWRPVLCLQRSAAATCLLRRYGIPAQMVIGAQHMPFKAHAWVEVNRSVVNDKPYTPDIYAVLDRC